jgi:putative Mg2+ transporter-C (MgtC) family protein
VSVGLGSVDVAVMLSLVTLVTLWMLSPLRRGGAPDGMKAADVDKEEMKDDQS